MDSKELKLETTMEEWAQWIADQEGEDSHHAIMKDSPLHRAKRDRDRILADNARLKAELADLENDYKRAEAVAARLHAVAEKAMEQLPARETTAHSSELRFLSTFTPILDKRVQTTEQLFGWMAACEAWRAAIAARRKS